MSSCLLAFFGRVFCFQGDKTDLTVNLALDHADSLHVSLYSCTVAYVLRVLKMQIAQICGLEERIHRLGASIHIAKLVLKCEE